MTQPFDQDLYDKVMADPLAGTLTDYGFIEGGDYAVGYENAALAAARLAAARSDGAAAVVGDVELARLVWEARGQRDLKTGGYSQDATTPFDDLDRRVVAGLAEDVRVVREALAAQAVQVPDGFAKFAADVQEWQRETFPGGTSVGAVEHLVEEAGELADAIKHGPSDEAVREEAADVLLLLIAVVGLEGFDLMAAAQEKMAINRARAWETVPNERGYRKHIEQAEGGQGE